MNSIGTVTVPIPSGSNSGQYTGTIGTIAATRGSLSDGHNPG